MPTSSINRVILIGNLTRDPELRPLGSESSVCHLRIACNGRRRDKEGNWTDRAHYFDVSVFGPHGVTSNRYLRKGKQVAIDGRLEWREWEGPDQQKRQSVSIVADTVQFLGAPDPRPAAEADAGAGPGAGAAPGEAPGAGDGRESESAAAVNGDAAATSPDGELEPVGAAAGAGVEDPDELTF
jgi:single-strand DNA-binding protein